MCRSARRCELHRSEAGSPADAHHRWPVCRTWVPAAPYFLAGLVFASKDPVANDAIATACMNLNRGLRNHRPGRQAWPGQDGVRRDRVVGTPLEEAIIQDFPKHPYKARKWPWTPTMYGKVANWDQSYRHELYGCPTIPGGNAIRLKSQKVGGQICPPLFFVRGKRFFCVAAMTKASSLSGRSHSPGHHIFLFFDTSMIHEQEPGELAGWTLLPGWS